MPRPFEGLEETLRTLRDDEACADMDRRIAERLAKGGVEPLGPVEVPPDADRSSLEWLWAEPEPTGELKPAAEPSERTPATIRVRRSREFLSAARVGGAAVAASALFAAGLLIGRGGGERYVPLDADVAITTVAVRGPGSIDSIRVESRSDARAFVTVVGLVPGRRPAVHYRESQQFMDVAARSVRRVDTLPASFNGAVAVLVVLSPIPVGEAVRQIAQGGLSDERPQEAREALRAGLEDLGFRGFTIEMVEIPKREG